MGAKENWNEGLEDAAAAAAAAAAEAELRWMVEVARTDLEGLALVSSVVSCIRLLVANAGSPGMAAASLKNVHEAAATARSLCRVCISRPDRGIPYRAGCG